MVPVLLALTQKARVNHDQALYHTCDVDFYLILLDSFGLFHATGRKIIPSVCCVSSWGVERCAGVRVYA